MKTIEELKIEAAATSVSNLGDDLSNKDLSGVCFENADLSLKDLSYSDLTGANFRNANLYNADLRGANLEGANLFGANLINACLTHANLKNANLHSANLTYAVLIKSNLEIARVINANLSNANLVNANLKSADLEYANLSSADLSYTDLTHTNLTKANLTNANLFEAKRRNLDYIMGRVLEEPITGYKYVRKDILVEFFSKKKVISISLPMIIKLEIPKGATVFCINGSKCRTNKAKALEILKYDEDHMTELIHILTGIKDSEFKIVNCLNDHPVYSSYQPVKIGGSRHSKFIYPLGKIVEVPYFNLQYNVECASGIHFFMTEEETMNYIRRFPVYGLIVLNEKGGKI